jgi:hypothetical protein
MFPPGRLAKLLEQFAQSCRGDIVVEVSADHQIGALVALVLAEAAREANGDVGSARLRILIENGQVLRVSPRKAGTPEADDNLDCGIL